MDKVDIQIKVYDREGVEHDITVPTDIGMTLMEACKAYDLGVEGTCGGMALCASCQVYVESDHQLHEHLRIHRAGAERDAELVDGERGDGGPAGERGGRDGGGDRRFEAGDAGLHHHLPSHRQRQRQDRGPAVDGDRARADVLEAGPHLPGRPAGRRSGRRRRQKCLDGPPGHAQNPDRPGRHGNRTEVCPVRRIFDRPRRLRQGVHESRAN